MSIIENLSYLVWPPRCTACETILNGKEEIPLCDDCLNAITLCYDFTPPSRIEYASAFFTYEGPIVELITKWKYHQDFAAQKTIIALCKKYATEILPPEIPEDTILIPIPPHPKRLAERGFDPAFTLAETFFECFKENLENKDILPKFEPDLLIRTKHTPKQASLDTQEREKNVENAFDTNASFDAPVILVDDVCTTGSTANACAEKLMQSGAQMIYLITFAKTIN